MKKILITCALEKELQVAKKYFRSSNNIGYKIYFLCLGVGSHKTILNLTEHLQKLHYDFIINYGVCGYNETKQDCIQIVRSYHPGIKKEILTPIFFKFTTLKEILCSDSPILSNKQMIDMPYVDMESYGFEMVCEHMKVPRIILKVPVDKVGEETKNFDIHYACELLEKNIDFDGLILKIDSYLETLPVKGNIEKYIKSLQLTASEEIILYKYIQAFESLSREKFEVFYNQYKNLEKKKFLGLLAEHINTLKSLLG